MSDFNKSFPSSVPIRERYDIVIDTDPATDAVICGSSRGMASKKRRADCSAFRLCLTSPRAGNAIMSIQ